MTRVQKILIGTIGIALFGTAVGEHLYRSILERRYQESVQGRRRLEQQVGDMLKTHDQLKSDLVQERERSKGLSEALSMAQAKMEETLIRLTEESKSVRELQLRLASMEQQMNQLQGELVVALQQRSAPVSEIQLEKVLVSAAGATAVQGRVVSIHPDWNFVIVNLGWDQVKLGETVSIFRDDRLLAKARVERVQEEVCAATILPDWKIETVNVNDDAKLL